MKKTFLSEKITKWEHWPTFMFYVPNLPYAFLLATKAKHPAFFSAVNPAIKSSGNGTESKYETIQLVPEKHKPKSILVKPNTNFTVVLEKIQEENILFPLIAKPDIGFRGLLVKKIKDAEALKVYLNSYKIDILIQEFLDYKNECGVFYHRIPDQKKGAITSLTLKEFTAVTGNGVNTLKELINKDERAKLYLELFTEIHGEKLNAVPEKDKTIQLTDIGNHSKGTQFLNGNELISEKLEKTFDTLSHTIDGWFYGRIDIKYNDFKDLENGADFKILEINGIISEPTHIYDSAKYTYFKALKAIRNHWRIVYLIASTNHKQHKVGYKKASVFIKEMIYLKRYLKMLKKM